MKDYSAATTAPAAGASVGIKRAGISDARNRCQMYSPACAATAFRCWEAATGSAAVPASTSVGVYRAGMRDGVTAQYLYVSAAAAAGTARARGIANLGFCAAAAAAGTARNYRIRRTSAGIFSPFSAIAPHSSVAAMSTAATGARGVSAAISTAPAAGGTRRLATGTTKSTDTGSAANVSSRSCRPRRPYCASR